MHRSRLASFWIDVPGDLFGPAQEFWRDGLGYDAQPSTLFPDTYVRLGTWSGFQLGVQRIDEGPVRWHLDVGTGDGGTGDGGTATAAALRGVGARVDSEFEGWVRMVDPCGMPFCIVPGESAVWLDIPSPVFAEGVAFWAGALGRVLEPEAPGSAYSSLGRLGELVTVGIQRLGHGDARWHVDIESDDVPAEIARLEQLGAQPLEPIESWWTLRDPIGQVFCVTQIQTDGFADATPWP